MTPSGSTGERRPVCIIEEHPLAAFWLAEFLRSDSKLSVSVSPAPSRPGTLAGRVPSAVIVDGDALSVPLIAFLAPVAAAFPAAPVLVLGRTLDQDRLSWLVPNGVRGFVAYHVVERELRPAIHSLLAGRVWFSPRALERYALCSSVARGKRSPPGLTARERQIVALLGQRLSNKEMGSVLSITERTVRFHLRNTFQKLGVRDRYGVVEVARATETMRVAGHAL